MPPSRGAQRVASLATQVVAAAEPLPGPPSAAVPTGFELFPGEEEEDEVAAHLHWLAQKFALGQDVMLLGPPGALRRQLALRFCELRGLEAEVLTVTRDTTEADLKQRRELTTGPSGTQTTYADGPPVRCAIRGRVLILDGLEKAERNVLPTLNNLLENREMALDDGRFLVSARRFDALPPGGADSAAGDRSRLVRVHEGFRVIALGLPCPPCLGNPLDPPLRSRFQARVVRTPPLTSSARLRELMAAVGTEGAELLQRLEVLQRELNAHALGERLPVLSHDSLLRVARLVSGAGLLPPHARPSPREALARAYPLEQLTIHRDLKAKEADLQWLGSFDLGRLPAAGAAGIASPLQAATSSSPGSRGSSVQLCFAGSDVSVEFLSPALPAPPTSDFIASPALEHLTTALAQDFAVGHDCLLIGPPGCGKSALARRLAAMLGYGAPGGSGLEFFFLYEEMSSRDLLQRRTVDATGRTAWADSPLVRAARTGALCILDGVHRLRWDVLCTLAPVLQDRQATLALANDGLGADSELLLRADRYEAVLRRLPTQAPAGFDEASNCRVARVHPAFRVLALAEPPNAMGPWLCDELSTCFSHHLYPRLAPADLVGVLSKLVPEVPEEATQRLVAVLAPEQAAASAVRAVPGDAAAAKDFAVPLRVLIRVARRAAVAHTSVDAELLSGILQQALFPFLPKGEKAELLGRLRRHFSAESLKAATARALRHGTSPSRPPGHSAAEEGGAASGGTLGDVVPVGNFLAPLGQPRRPELVPSVEFVDIGRHTELLEELARALFERGERYLLLLGPQGVGKNRVVDHLLQLLRLEREYMQLHRDTTVSQLTATPAVEGGRLLYKDSPLVRAAEQGRVLVLDEADKAPLEVVIVLKSLVEDGQLALPDGRRLARFAQASKERDPSAPPVVPIHADFRMLVLANRPGFPFLGNDLLREANVFSVFCLDNPDTASELQLVRAFGPRVPEAMLRSLVGIFADLRLAVEEGRLQYPYSTRELLAVVKHLNRFPDEPLEGALASILAFDRFDPAVREVLRPIFEKRGLPAAVALGAPLESAAPEAPSWMRALPTLRSVRLAATAPLAPPVLAGSWAAAGSVSIKAKLHALEARPLGLEQPQPAPLPELLFERARDQAEFSEAVVHAKLPLGSRSGPVVDAVAGIWDDDALESGSSGTGRALHALSISPLCIWTLEDPLAVGAQAGRCTSLHLGASNSAILDPSKTNALLPVVVNGRTVPLGTPQLLWVPSAGPSGGALLLHSPLDSSSAQVLIERPHHDNARFEVLSTPPLRSADARLAVEESFVAVPIATWEVGAGAVEDGALAGGMGHEATADFAPASSALFFQPRSRRLVQLDVEQRQAREVALEGPLAAQRGFLGRLRGSLGLGKPAALSVTASAAPGQVEVLVSESFEGVPSTKFLCISLAEGFEQSVTARWIEAHSAPASVSLLSSSQQGPSAQPVLPAVAGAGLGTGPFSTAVGMAFAAASPAEGLVHTLDGLSDRDGSRKVWALDEEQRLARPADAVVPSLPPRVAQAMKVKQGSADADHIVEVGPELPCQRDECWASDVMASTALDLLVRVLVQPSAQGEWLEAVHLRTQSVRRLPARSARELDLDVGGGRKAGVARTVPWPSPPGGHGVWDVTPDLCVVFRDGTLRLLELHPESLERSLRNFLDARGLGSLLPDDATLPPEAEAQGALQPPEGASPSMELPQGSTGISAGAPLPPGTELPQNLDIEQPPEEEPPPDGERTQAVQAAGPGGAGDEVPPEALAAALGQLPQQPAPEEGAAEQAGVDASALGQLPQQPAPEEGAAEQASRQQPPEVDAADQAMGQQLPHPPAEAEGVEQASPPELAEASGGEPPQPPPGAGAAQQVAGPERIRDEALRRALAEALKNLPPQPPPKAETEQADERQAHADDSGQQPPQPSPEESAGDLAAEGADGANPASAATAEPPPLPQGEGQEEQGSGEEKGQLPEEAIEQLARNAQELKDQLSDEALQQAAEEAKKLQDQAPDKGLEQLSEEAKERIAAEAREAAREMGEKARLRRQAEIDMVGDDYNLYARILADVQSEIEQLRRVLSSASARQRERVWHRGLEGELDENRIVDAIAGEAAVFKRRAEREQRPGDVLLQPKRITFLFDTSSSMYHFNTTDGRLRRSCEAAVMLMEALRGFEAKFDYEFCCHGGDYVVKELVSFGRPPADEKERLQVVSQMLRAAQFSAPGDNTLQAIDRACERVAAAGLADDYFVFAFSDGHLKQYGITSEVLSRTLAKHSSVNTVCFFIANVEEEALAMAQQMPDKVKLCIDLKTLPAELRQQFVSSVARGQRSSL